MTQPRRFMLPLLGLLLTAFLAACGTGSRSSSSPARSASGSAAACRTAALPVEHKGVLTVATDSPAYPPYFENNKPANGKGFESAVAFAVAKRLGFAPNAVNWVVEPFNASYAPGAKPFDFDVNEISITPARSKVVDFSPSYYENPQAVIVASSSPLAHTTGLAALKNARIGVQVGTTSLEAVHSEIKPSAQPQVFKTSNDVVSAFKLHRVDAIVVDLATAFELTATTLPQATIAGQFSAPGGDKWGLLLGKGSGLTACVTKAVTTLQRDGTLAALSTRWIAAAANVPVLRQG